MFLHIVFNSNCFGILDIVSQFHLLLLYVLKSVFILLIYIFYIERLSYIRLKSSDYFVLY